MLGLVRHEPRGWDILKSQGCYDVERSPSGEVAGEWELTYQKTHSGPVPGARVRLRSKGGTVRGRADEEGVVELDISRIAGQREGRPMVEVTANILGHRVTQMVLVRR